MTVTVMILDDHEVVRRGLRELLESDGDLRVVTEASTAAEGIARAKATRPDVAVLDVRLPDGDGIEVCREIRSRSPGTRCLILTSHSDDEALYASVLAGASGYLLKDVGGVELVEAVKKVARGESLLDPRVTESILERFRSAGSQREAEGPLEGLSPQERRLLELLAEGLTNRQIAERMHLAEKTVKNYVSSLLSKLGMNRRTEAAVYAARLQERRRRGRRATAHETDQSP